MGINVLCGDDFREFLESHPLFEKILRDEQPFFIGKVDITDDTGYLWESYEIEIQITGCYPRCFPSVREISNKIPRDIDWHVISDDGLLCLAVRPEAHLICRQQGTITLSWFLSNIVLPHLASQTYKKEFGYYPNGECSHGDAGIWNYYFKMLNTTSREVVAVFLMLFAYNKHPKDRDICLCGSGKFFLNCHLKNYLQLGQLDPLYLRGELQLLFPKK